MNKPDTKTIKNNLSKILSATKSYRRSENATSGMIFTDNWYDSHPRLLIFDPVLNPYDKLVWLAIRSRCTPDMSLTSFPSYDEIQSMLNISRGTVSNSISKLRITRWITLLCKDQERNETGQFTKAGNIYMVHGEPLSLPDTFELDSNYMTYLSDCRKHRNSDVRKISELILSSLRHDINLGQNLMEYKHPFERRADAWMAVDGNAQVSFFGAYSKLEESDGQGSHCKVQEQKDIDQTTAVHAMNYGQTKTLEQSDQAAAVHEDSVVHTSSKLVVEKNNYYKQFTDKPLEAPRDLIYPTSVSENQKHLIELTLKRLPDSLPEPPKPWDSWQQLLLDELEGRIQAGLDNKCTPVWNPVSLLAVYCNRLIENGVGLRDEGLFQIENAERVIQKRTEHAKHEKLFNETKQKYQQRTLEQAMQNKPKSPVRSNEG